MTTTALRLPFIRHSWPYPSAVSLLSGLARVHVLGRREIAALWLSGSACKRFASQLDGMRHWVTDEHIGTSLHLTIAEVPLAFDPTRWWPEALRALAAAFVEPLRFCPICLLEGYHTYLFQLPWWIRCPVHGVALRNTCQHCGAELTGLGPKTTPAHAFRCKGCHRDYANTAALINASRGLTVERWHTVVAVHRRWASAISKAFLVAPAPATEYCEISSEHVFEWIHAAGVTWPTEIREFVAETRSVPRSLTRHWTMPEINEMRVLGPLAKQILDAPDTTDFRSRLFTPHSVPVAKALVKLEKRLRRGADLKYPAARTEAYLDPHRSEEPLIPGRGMDESLVVAGIRDRGYRRRTTSMTVDGLSGGPVRLAIHHSDLTALCSLKLLSHLDDWLRSIPEMVDSHPAKTLVQWWHSHLLIQTLVDGTIASIHAVAWPPPGCVNHKIPGWPPIDLNRHPPGHAWMLAATYRQGRVVAYLRSVSLAKAIRLDVQRRRERQLALRLGILTFQVLATESPVGGNE